MRLRRSRHPHLACGFRVIQQIAIFTPVANYLASAVQRRNAMSRWSLFTVSVVALAVPLDVTAQQQFPATLAGHAYLPAQAISLAPPQDAPESFAI
jgi:hypothetical protein